MTTAVAWTPAERHAWHLPERLKPSEWCEKSPIYIPANAINPEPGPMDMGRTPYLREVMDCILDPHVREVWCYKATQIGFTRMLINLACYTVDQQPGALGLLLPDEDTVEEVFAEELYPTIDASPVMRRHKTKAAWDKKKRICKLDSMPIFGLYAGSVQKLGRRTLRYALADEIDKYRPFHREASPIQLLRKRLSNWKHKSRALFGSTPTTREGNIAQGYETCPDKREYACRCPHCGHYEIWKWSSVKGFKDIAGGTKEERANAVKLNQPCYYECSNCRKPITEREKQIAVGAGVWVSGKTEQGVWHPIQTVRLDGTLEGERPATARIGFHIPALLSPWLSFSDLAAEFIEAEGDIDKTRDFHNARQALPFDEVVRSTRPSLVREKKAISGPPLVVPKWAVAVYATFDTQKDWFAGVIRAWGYGFKSALIWHGQCYTFDEVYKLGLESRFEIEGGGIASPKALLIDSGGDRTDDVYQFARRDQRIYPTKGMSVSGRKLWHDTDVGNGVRLRLVDVDHFKNALDAVMHDPDATKWLPHREVSEQYCLEMASEHLVIERGKRVWKEKGTSRNEAWDCEVMQRAAAEMDNLGVRIEQKQEQAPKKSEGSENPLNYRGKW